MSRIAAGRKARVEIRHELNAFVAAARQPAAAGLMCWFNSRGTLHNQADPQANVIFINQYFITYIENHGEYAFLRKRSRIRQRLGIGSSLGSTRARCSNAKSIAAQTAATCAEMHCSGVVRELSG